MNRCDDCGLILTDCNCSVLNEFMEENQDLMDDIAEMEAQESSPDKRCYSCFFFNCRCARGLSVKKA